MDSTISSVMAMESAYTQMQVATAALKKQNDLVKQQGEMALQMIQSVPAPQGSLGQNIDVKA